MNISEIRNATQAKCSLCERTKKIDSIPGKERQSKDEISRRGRLNAVRATCKIACNGYSISGHTPVIEYTHNLRD